MEMADKIQRMIRPEALKKNEPLQWSTGMGTDVWEMFCAAITGDLESIKRLLSKDPSLVRGSHTYRTPLYFAVRENDPPCATPLAWAARRGHDQVVGLLRRFVKRAKCPPAAWSNTRTWRKTSSKLTGRVIPERSTMARSRK